MIYRAISLRHDNSMAQRQIYHNCCCWCCDIVAVVCDVVGAVVGDVIGEVTLVFCDFIVIELAQKS